MGTHKENAEDRDTKVKLNFWERMKNLLYNLCTKAPTGENEVSADSGNGLNTNAFFADSGGALHSVGSDNDVIESDISRAEKEDIGDKSQDIAPSISEDRLVESTIDLIMDLDRRAARSDESMKYVYEDISFKLIENLILSGCIPINPQEGDVFEAACHMTLPYSFPPEKSEVKATSRLGVMSGEKVLLKAIVELKEETDEILQPSTQES